MTLEAAVEGADAVVFTAQAIPLGFDSIAD